MTSRPVIGITAALEPAGWAVWNGIDANVSQRTYSLNVADAGAIPILLPADEASTGSPDELLRVLDGLLVAGGADLDPASYGTEPEPSTAGYNAERDRFELALTRRALELELPVLAVCRGLEILNVACRARSSRTSRTASSTSRLPAGSRSTWSGSSADRSRPGSRAPSS